MNQSTQADEVRSKVPASVETRLSESDGEVHQDIAASSTVQWGTRSALKHIVKWLNKMQSDTADFALGAAARPTEQNTGEVQYSTTAPPKKDRDMATGKIRGYVPYILFMEN